jgi:hypothetical protein
VLPASCQPVPSLVGSSWLTFESRATVPFRFFQSWVTQHSSKFYKHRSIFQSSPGSPWNSSSPGFWLEQESANSFCKHQDYRYSGFVGHN